MRIVKLNERWFDVPNDADKARIKIKHLLPGEISDIYDEVFTQEVSYKRDDDGKLEPIFSQKTDKKKDRELTLINTIVDWENFFDADGLPLECNKKNIRYKKREMV